jgi:hypothetical protein
MDLTSFDALNAIKSLPAVAGEVRFKLCSSANPMASAFARAVSAYRSVL